jgi:hypothetical protein
VLIGASRLLSEDNGPELLTGAALAAAYAVGLGAVAVAGSSLLLLGSPVGSPMQDLGVPNNSGAWQVAHLLVTLAVFAAALRTGSRELGIVGALSLVVFAAAVPGARSV